MKQKKNKISEVVMRNKVSSYINEGLTSSDVDKIRKLIRTEIAEIFFTLFRKRGTWI